jgi:plastocyanin
MNKRFFRSALAVLAIGLVALPASADARGVHVRKMRLQDNCDPVTFNAAFGDGICVPHGNGRTTTLPEFLAKLNPQDFGHEKWNNHPDELDLKLGDEISVVVRGGEGHTFTEVDAFGAGCFLPINDALGLTDPPTPEKCGEYFANTSVAANGASTLTVSGLTPGTHLFMCEIHPWMRTVVEVGDDD